MRLSVLLILLVLIAICAAKSSKSKSQKTTKHKTSKVIETKKHKDAKHKDAGKKHKSSNKHGDSRKKEKAPKTADKPVNKTIIDKDANKTHAKLSNKTVRVEKKENSTKAILMKGPPADCQKIIDEYSNGKILLYEYKIQMGRCLKKAKEGDSTANADVKSALLRPDDSPKGDSDLAVNVRPFNEHSTEETDDDDYDTNHDEFRDNDNNNDNDYSEDEEEEDEPDELADKKMQVPGPTGFQAPYVPTTENNLAAQPQLGMPGQQAATFYPMDQTQYNAVPAAGPAPVPQLSQAAFAPGPMNQYPGNPVPFQTAGRNMAMNTVAKSDIPESLQPQASASQANAVFDQWRASSFGAATADKKDQTPSAPEVPANDQFAEFMKMQSASSNSMEAASASQQTAVPAATQQRSDIPQQQNMFPAQPQTLTQTTNMVHGLGQAYYMQPQEIGNFP